MSYGPRSTTTLTKVWVDILILAATLATLSVPLTGLAWHEWLGILIVVPLVIHLLLNWRWIVVALRTFFTRLPNLTRVNLVLNLALFVTMTTVIFTGIAVSEIALPAVGLQSMGHNPYMRHLHFLSADALILVVGLHLGLNWRWILTMLRRYVTAPLAVRLGRAPAA